MRSADIAHIGWHLLRTRCLRFADRDRLEAWQARRIAAFLRERLPRSVFYRGHAGAALADLPVMDKAAMLANFTALNTAGITLEEATATALASESSRDFAPVLRGVTVGLSSGTQGVRGVFLASAAERTMWAGILLARVLPGAMLRTLLVGHTPLRVAFFLRANSNLYTTLGNRRIDFHFYDLFTGVDAHLPPLARQVPDILVAPARILAQLARLVLAGLLRLAPRRVIAVAEVLEPDDRAAIEAAFGLVVHQLYQCTEGFLGYTCEHGTLHLNEEFVHIEPEWLDAEKTRFVPVVTDFTRQTQLIVRYRLGDVLRRRAGGCACGNAAMALDAIEGRCDDVLWLPDRSGVLCAVYPDMLRHAVSSAAATLPDYRIAQHGGMLRLAVADEAPQSWQALCTAVGAVFARQGLPAPPMTRMPFVAIDPHAKRRRIVCVERPAHA